MMRRPWLACAALAAARSPWEASQDAAQCARLGDAAGACAAALETAATSERAAPGGAVVAYWGAGEPGYNYFLPEPRALARLLADAGFADVHVTDEAPRILAAARRPDAYADFLRAGFSRPGVYCGDVCPSARRLT